MVQPETPFGTDVIDNYILMKRIQFRHRGADVVLIPIQRSEKNNLLSLVLAAVQVSVDAAAESVPVPRLTFKLPLSLYGCMNLIQHASGDGWTRMRPILPR